MRQSLKRLQILKSEEAETLTAEERGLHLTVRKHFEDFALLARATRPPGSSGLIHQARTPIPVTFDGGGHAGDFPWALLQQFEVL